MGGLADHELECGGGGGGNVYAGGKSFGAQDVGAAEELLAGEVVDLDGLALGEEGAVAEGESGGAVGVDILNS